VITPESASNPALTQAPLLTIAVSSRALFDLEKENELFEQAGMAAYEAYQVAHETEPLPPGPGFPLIRAILRLNPPDGPRRVEVVVFSRNNPAVAVRLMNSVAHHRLDIRRAVFTAGTPVTRYLAGYGADLFLSRHESDVREALAAGVAAGLLYASPDHPTTALEVIRIAFDADAVVFSDEAERYYLAHGLEAFLQHERDNASQPLAAGPLAQFLKKLTSLRQLAGPPALRLAMFTARCSPAHERVIKTLRVWGVSLDELFLLGGQPKDQVLAAFAPHIFFDDQAVNCLPASRLVPTAQVPRD